MKRFAMCLMVIMVSGCSYSMSVSTKNIAKAEELCSTNSGIDSISVSKPLGLVIYSVECKNKAEFLFNENGVAL